MDISIDVLKESPLFKGCSDEDLYTLFNEIKYTIKEYRSDEMIISQGDDYDFLGIVLKGILVTEFDRYDGQVVKIEKLKPFDLLAPGFIFNSKKTFPVTILSETESAVLLMEKSQLTKMFEIDRTVMNNFLTIVSDKVYFLWEKLRSMSLKSLKEKVGNYLLRFNKSEIVLPMSYNELAEFLGTTRPSLSRILISMEKEGLIEVQNSKIITIKDIEKFKREIQVYDL